jgi:hypothetical protein
MNANDANTTNIRNIDISLLSWLLALLSVVCCQSSVVRRQSSVVCRLITVQGKSLLFYLG